MAVAALYTSSGSYSGAAEGHYAGSVFGGAVEGPADTSLVPGDRLRVSIFEHAPPNDDKWTERRRSDGLEPMFYARPEVSGDFAVQVDGALNIPILGSVAVVGRSLADVQASIEAAYSDVYKRAARATIVLAERAPVYIVGRVKQQGVFKFTPGLTVMHVVALAGGFDKDADDRWTQVESIREGAKHDAALDQWKRAVVRQSVLTAERDGTDPVLPRRATELLGSAEMQKILADELARRSRIRIAENQQKDELERSAQTADKASSVLADRVSTLSEIVAARRERLASLRQLTERGTASKPMLAAARAELSDAEDRRLSATSAQVEGNARALSARDKLEQLKTNRLIQLDRDLAISQREMVEAEAALVSSSKASDLLQRSAAQLSKDNPESTDSFEIVRQTAKGPQVIAATGISIVRPGDLIRTTSPSKALAYR